MLSGASRCASGAMRPVQLGAATEGGSADCLPRGQSRGQGTVGVRHSCGTCVCVCVREGNDEAVACSSFMLDMRARA
jgi:hypothetical protein